MAKIPGTEIELGDKKFVLPPLTLGMLRNGVAEKLRRYDELTAESKHWDARLLSGEIILEALRRNYDKRALSDEDFWDRIDLGNDSEAFRAVLGLSGFQMGEAGAAREAGILTPSTLPSPQPTDGTTSE